MKKITQNRTVITIAHRLSTIQNADNIAVLDNGQIIHSKYIILSYAISLLKITDLSIYYVIYINKVDKQLNIVYGNLQYSRKPNTKF